jgi:hypothetical protein
LLRGCEGSAERKKTGDQVTHVDTPATLLATIVRGSGWLRNAQLPDSAQAYAREGEKTLSNQIVIIHNNRFCESSQSDFKPLDQRLDPNLRKRYARV